jgi:hypothetical protein
MKLLLEDVSQSEPDQVLAITAAQAHSILHGLFQAVIIDRYGCEGRTAGASGYVPVPPACTAASPPYGPALPFVA